MNHHPRSGPLAAFAEEVLAREAKAAEPPRRRTSRELMDACANMRGWLTGEEVAALFGRHPPSELVRLRPEPRVERDHAAGVGETENGVRTVA